ncbi:MAG: hypothetical protein ACYDBH_20130 [Acidobacteriaceae bacterium]
MTDDTDHDPFTLNQVLEREAQLTPERRSYLLCGRAQANAAWLMGLMGQYDKAADDGLALRACRHLREANRHLEAALRYHADARQRERYQQQFSTLLERVLSAIEAISEGAKLPAGRDLDAKTRRTTLLNLYVWSQKLGHGINESYRNIAAQTQSTPDAIEQALRGYAKPYMDRGIKREDGLLCAFHEIDIKTLAKLDKFEKCGIKREDGLLCVSYGIGVKKLADFANFELMEKVLELSEEKADDLILRARGLKTGD